MARAKTKPKAKAAPKRARAKPKTKPKAKPKTRPKAKPKAKAKPKTKPKAKPRKRAVSGGGAIVRILDAKQPLDALTKFLAAIDGPLSVQEGQIVLGSAHLLLAGGGDANALLDLVLSRWAELPDRTGFHAQELLRNAFAAVGGDRERVMQLSALVPIDASAELRLGHACALAAAGERTAMLRAAEAALAAGVSPAQLRRAAELAPYADDPGFTAMLERATAPLIPVDIAPHVEVVRGALDEVTRMLREFGEHVVLEPPASLDAVLASERAAKIQLPNDYRALLTLTDGMTLTDNRFFGTVDYRNETKLARDAREFVAQIVDECVPLANWGQPTDWLLYDPYGRLRGGAPGYILRLATEQVSLDGLAHALDRFERIMRDVLGTN